MGIFGRFHLTERKKMIFHNDKLIYTQSFKFYLNKFKEYFDNFRVLRKIEINKHN